MARLQIQPIGCMRIAAIAAAAGAVTAITMTALAGEPVTLPQFSDQTAASGLVFTHQTSLPAIPNEREEWHMMTPGVAVADFNRDGWLDVFINGGAGQNSALFINNGNGSFTDRALEWGIDLTDAEGSSATVGDINADGWPDIYVGTMDGRNYLLVNSGAGSFTENAIAAGVDLTVPVEGEAHQRNTFGGAFGDVDLDGDLDLYTTQWWFESQFGNRLFLNDGSGVFTDVTVSHGLLQGALDEYWAFTPILQDMNGDFYPELIVAADFSTSRYFVNDGDGTFTRVTGNGTATDENGMGAAIGDYDGDGDPDWFITSIYDDDFIAEANWGVTGNRLYRNDGADLFTDTTGPGLNLPIPPDGPGVRHGFWGWGTAFADFDHDGDLDLTMTNGFELPPGGTNHDPDFLTDPTRLWINDGDYVNGPNWTESAIVCGINHIDDGKGLVVFDYDNDGDLDILITSNMSDVVLYRNDIDQLLTNYSDSWIEIDLIAPPGVAPGGIGAKIEITSLGVTSTRWVNTGGSFMSGGPGRVHFGLKPAKSIDELRISWPNGLVTHMFNVEPGQIILGAVGNINGDDHVGVADLGFLLADFGTGEVRSDLNNDGAVDTADLGMLIRNFGLARDGAGMN